MSDDLFTRACHGHCGRTSSAMLDVQGQPSQQTQGCSDEHKRAVNEHAAEQPAIALQLHPT